MIQYLMNTQVLCMAVHRQKSPPYCLYIFHNFIYPYNAQVILKLLMPIVLLTRESHGYKFIPFFQSLSVYINKKYMLFY